MAAPPIDFFNSVLWMWTTILVSIVSVVGFLAYRYYFEPPIARQFTSARWSKGPVGFIQDDANQVHLVTSKAALPEGIIYTKRGFFLQSRPPYIPDGAKRVKVNPIEILTRLQQQYPEADQATLGKLFEETMDKIEKANEEKSKPGPKKKDENKLTDEEHDALNTILQTPVLAGFGRSVFFGYDGAPLVGNLKTHTHANLRVMKEIIPATISRTQLGNLYRWAVNKGYEKKGGDQMKLLMIVIIAVIPIAALGIVAFMLINAK